MWALSRKAVRVRRGRKVCWSLQGGWWGEQGVALGSDGVGQVLRVELKGVGLRF